ncbi:hypothetical protein JCM10212_001532 [Sporobolomyces blumeae]
MAHERAQTPLEQYLVPSKPRPDAFTVSAAPGSMSTSSRLRAPSVKPAQATRPRPYSSLAEATKDLDDKPAIEGGIRAYNKAIRNTLGKDDCPVTSSTSYARTMHVQSCATGHQGGGGRSGAKWTLHRNQKLRIQAADKVTDSLKGVVGYISGYTGNEMTNLELKACVERQGGTMLTMASARCTHIFVTTNLSGSKAQKYLESKKKNRYKLVLPDWAVECEKAGKRLSESRFVAPIRHESQGSAFEIYASHSASTSTSTSTSTSASTMITSSSSTALLKSASSLLPAPSNPPSASTDIPQRRLRSPAPRSPPPSRPVANDAIVVLSPSPSPKSKPKRRKTSTRSTSSSSTATTTTSFSAKEVRSARYDQGKGKEKNDDPGEVLILGSSDVEVEDPNVARALRSRETGSLSQRLRERPPRDLEQPASSSTSRRLDPGGNDRRLSESHDEQDNRDACDFELDEFDMPPSAQRR